MMVSGFLATLYLQKVVMWVAFYLNVLSQEDFPDSLTYFEAWVDDLLFAYEHIVALLYPLVCKCIGKRCALNTTTICKE